MERLLFVVRPLKIQWFVKNAMAVKQPAMVFSTVQYLLAKLNSTWIIAAAES